MLYEALLLAVVLSILTKGSLKNLAKADLKGVLFVFIAFALKYGLDFFAYKGHVVKGTLLVTVQIMAYLLLFIFLYQNSKLPGMKIMFIGMLLNFVVIIANHGAMPADLSRLNPAALTLFSKGKVATHVLLTSQTKLPWLADIFYQPLPKPAKFSIGDILISVGVFYLVWVLMHSRKRVDNYRVDSFLGRHKV